MAGRQAGLSRNGPGLFAIATERPDRPSRERIPGAFGRVAKFRRADEDLCGNSAFPPELTVRPGLRIGWYLPPNFDLPDENVAY
jgi:hypothetical protein